MTEQEKRNQIMQSHMDVVLGNSLDVILDEARRRLPRISEYQFQREVLDILACPFGLEVLQRYLPYVGEFVHPLLVVDNNDNSKVLFEVPALTQTLQPSMATGSKGYSAENFFRSLARERELTNPMVLAEKIGGFLQVISHHPDYISAVVKPIMGILARYGRTMTTPDGEELTIQNGQLVLAKHTTPTTVETSEQTGSTFLDDFDD